MSDDTDNLNDLWQPLQQITKARIGLRRAGDAQDTAASLRFQYDHAQARDAVHTTLDADALAAEVRTLPCDTVVVGSAAPDRATFLQRPDLGRRLDDAARPLLAPWATAQGTSYDIVFVIADGLSALAVQRHAVPLLRCCVQPLRDRGWRVAPVVIARQARVALGDDIGAALGAEQVVVLIGERPGLSVADSLGVYLTYAPRVGRTDAERNCVSNIHPAGMSYADAADLVLYLVTEASHRKQSGVALKDDRREQPPRIEG